MKKIKKFFEEETATILVTMLFIIILKFISK
jgi:hypothetical protein